MTESINSQAPNPRRGGLLSSSLLVTALTSANMLVLFLLQLLIAALFGATGVTDAYFLATAIPSLLATAIAGSLNVCLIPSFMEIANRDGEAEAWRVAGTFLGTVVVCLTLLVAVLEVSAPALVHVLAPGFGPAQSQQTVDLLRLAVPSVPFLGGASILAGLYYAHRRFARPGLSVVANNVTGLAMILLMGQAFGIYVVALSLSVGAAVQFAVAMPILINRDGKLFPTVSVRDPRLRKLALLVVPLVLGSAVYKSDVLIGRVITSLLPSGDISYLAYAYRIALLAIALGSAGLTTAFFPRFAEYRVLGDHDALEDALRTSVRYVSFVMMGMVMLLSGTSTEFVRITLQRGEFTATATAATSAALLSYAGFIYANAVAGLFANLMYSMQRVKSVVVLGIGGLASYILLTVVLTPKIGYLGVGVAASCAAVLNLSVYVALAVRAGLRFGVLAFLSHTMRLGIAAGAGLLCLLLVQTLPLNQILGSLAAATVATLCYFLVAQLLGCHEASLAATRTVGGLRKVRARLLGTHHIGGTP